MSNINELMLQQEGAVGADVAPVWKPGQPASDATCAATGAGGDVLTLEKIREVRRMLDENESANLRMDVANAAAGLFNPFGELRIKESPLASRKIPARIHKWGRGQSLNYHFRIQKKWIKRYGVKREPCVFVLDGGQFGMGAMFVVPPGMAEALRDAAETGTGIYLRG